MPRPLRVCPPGIPVHVIQRGNNRQTCFSNDNDFAAYARCLAEGASKFRVQVHGWVFMTNHVHLLLTPMADDAVSKLMHSLGLRYVRHFNFKYARSGTLFEGRFKSNIILNDAYLLNCIRYIELNPVRAGMVEYPEEYRWSSYCAHGLGKKVGMWTPHPTYMSLGHDLDSRQAGYRELILDALEPETIVKIRHCANTGLPLEPTEIRH